MYHAYSLTAHVQQVHIVEFALNSSQTQSGLRYSYYSTCAYSDQKWQQLHSSTKKTFLSPIECLLQTHVKCEYCDFRGSN